MQTAVFVASAVDSQNGKISTPIRMGTSHGRVDSCSKLGKSHYLGDGIFGRLPRVNVRKPWKRPSVSCIRTGLYYTEAVRLLFLQFSFPFVAPIPEALDRLLPPRAKSLLQTTCYVCHVTSHFQPVENTTLNFSLFHIS